MHPIIFSIRVLLLGLGKCSMDLSLDMDKLLQLRRDYLEQVVRRQQQGQLKEVGMLEKYLFTFKNICSHSKIFAYIKNICLVTLLRKLLNLQKYFKALKNICI